MKLSDHIAQRGRSIDFTALGFNLPNPDPILRARGGRIELYRELRTDAHVGGCIRRRKSAVKSLEWGIDRGPASPRIAKGIEAMFADLDLERLIGEAMEAVLYGYQPLEILWKKVGSLIVPGEIVGKPPEWFHFDDENRLRFKTRDNPFHGEETPPMKFLLPRQDATYQNPYGFADLSMIFWPIVFKKGGVKFWLSFTEKFGSAFSVGKLPRSATLEERAQLLDSLEALIQDGVATIPDDGSIELVEMAGKTASADLYERLVMYCRSEVSIALTGTNQTTESTANKASAMAGLEVANDLRDGDAEIVEAAINQAIRWIVDINYGGQPAPCFEFWDQEARDKLQAERDKSNYDAGARFTNAYWERAYGYQTGDLAEPAAAVPPEAPTAGLPAVDPGKAPKTAEAEAEADPEEGAEFAAPAVKQSLTVADPTAADAARLATAAQPLVDDLIEVVRAMVDAAEDLGELQTALLDAYGDLNTAELTSLMAAAFALAELKGMAAVRGEATGRPVAFAEAPPAPQVINLAATFNLPEGFGAPAPVNVQNTIQMPEQPAPVVNNTIQVPEQPAPNVTFTAEVTPPAVNITNEIQPAAVQVTLPARKTETVVARDGQGNITRATQIETDLG
jgi:phage gp29-like protein